MANAKMAKVGGGHSYPRTDLRQSVRKNGVVVVHPQKDGRLPHQGAIGGPGVHGAIGLWYLNSLGTAASCRAEISDMKFQLRCVEVRLRGELCDLARMTRDAKRDAASEIRYLTSDIAKFEKRLAKLAYSKAFAKGGALQGAAFEHTAPVSTHKVVGKSAIKGATLEFNQKARGKSDAKGGRK